MARTKQTARRHNIRTISNGIEHADNAPPELVDDPEPVDVHELVADPAHADPAHADNAPPELDDVPELVDYPAHADNAPPELVDVPELVDDSAPKPVNDDKKLCDTKSN